MVQTEKSSVAQVYEQIVSDLKLAIGNLPVSNANGRAHYYAAKALLGKVYLQMAGEPLEDSKAAALAEVELNEVIQSGRFELVKDYFSLFDASNEYSSEYLFDVEFANNGTTTYGGQVGTIDGVQTPNNLYWSAVWSTQEFYETYDPADLRRDNIARFKYVYDDNQNLVKEDLSSEPIYYAYKFRHALTEEGRGPGWANWANPINFPIIRYADVLLSLAEAVNEQGRWQEAVSYVNRVRNRAGVALLNAPGNTNTKVSGVEEMRVRIRNEKKWELACEEQLYFEELRWGTWKTDKFVAKNGLQNVWGAPVYTYIWGGDAYLKWAIPQSEVEKNTNIKQNEGWN